MVLRTTQKFVNWVSCLYFLGALAMFIFLWAYIPVLHLIWTNLLDFAFNIMVCRYRRTFVAGYIVSNPCLRFLT